MAFFAVTGKQNPKTYRYSPNTTKIQNNLEKGEQNLTLSDLKTSYKATVIKTV